MFACLILQIRLKWNYIN